MKTYQSIASQTVFYKLLKFQMCLLFPIHSHWHTCFWPEIVLLEHTAFVGPNLNPSLQERSQTHRLYLVSFVELNFDFK